MAETLPKLIRQRATCKARVTQFETYLDGFRASGAPVETLLTKIEFVQNMWGQFHEVQTKIEDLDETDGETDEERATFEERYCEVIGRARAIVNSIQNPPAGNQDVGNVGNGAAVGGLKVRLPMMNLPVFDGNPERWLEFRDSFQGLIDTNQDLSNIERMYYLKSSLKGKAADVIQSLETTAENYQVAWNLLTKRFEDKRAIATRHLQLLLDVPGMQRESGIQLRQTLDGMLRHVGALKILKANTRDTVINHLMVAKLDSATRREWRVYIKNIEEVSFASLTEFLEDRCSIIEPETVKSAAGKSQLQNRVENKSAPLQKRVESSNTFASTSNDNRAFRKCEFCGEQSHPTYACQKFKDLTVPQRLNAVNERRLCRNCLRANHFAEHCPSSNCKRCNAKHNTLLHPSEKTEIARGSIASIANVNDSNSRNAEQQSSSVNCSSVSFPVPARVLLSTARILIYNSSERAHECRALLDSGSQSNFLTKEFCNNLKLMTRPFNCSIGGIAASINLTEVTSAIIRSRHTAYRAKVKFLITNRIIDELPLSQIEIGHLQIPGNIKLADEAFNVPGKIDMILGAGLFYELLCIGQVKLGRFQPILQKTHFGWIVSGSIASHEQQRSSVCCLSSEMQLRDQIEKFWKIEEVEQKPVVSETDKACEKHFLRTYQRDNSRKIHCEPPFSRPSKRTRRVANQRSPSITTTRAETGKGFRG